MASTDKLYSSPPKKEEILISYAFLSCARIWRLRHKINPSTESNSLRRCLNLIISGDMIIQVPYRISRLSSRDGDKIQFQLPCGTYNNAYACILTPLFVAFNLDRVGQGRLREAIGPAWCPIRSSREATWSSAFVWPGGSFAVPKIMCV